MQSFHRWLPPLPSPPFDHLQVLWLAVLTTLLLLSIHHLALVPASTQLRQRPASSTSSHSLSSSSTSSKSPTEPTASPIVAQVTAPTIAMSRSSSSRLLGVVFVSLFIALVYLYPTSPAQTFFRATQSRFTDDEGAFALGSLSPPNPIKMAQHFLGTDHQEHFEVDTTEAEYIQDFDDELRTSASNRGLVNMGYFTNWGIYSRNYKPLPGQIPIQSLSHLLYAFADVKPDTGEVFLTDSWADEQIHYANDSWNDKGTNLYGNFKQLNLLKRQNRSLKLLLSIGGWTYRSHFAPVASNAARRAKFVSSAVNILENYGLDGIDIDWEYPANAAEASSFTQLLKEVQAGLYSHAKAKSPKMPHYQLTVAAPCGAANYKVMDIKGMDKYLDYWNLMAYDYQGSWSSVTGYQDNLFGPQPSTESAVNYFRDQGVAGNKIIVGMPLYGRVFENTDGLGKSYNGIGQGDWEAGMYDYRNLPRPGAKEFYDAKAGASYSYDSSKREFVTYMTPTAAKERVKWLKAQGLGGAMYWEMSGDVRDSESNVAKRGLVNLIAKQLGPLDATKNHLSFPWSKFDNVKNGFKSL